MTLTPLAPGRADPQRGLTSSRISRGDVVRVGLSGLRARPARAVLSALGIAIGIATMVAVVGISASSQAQLLRRLDALGTNLLTVQPGQTLLGGGQSQLPDTAVPMVRRIGPVLTAAATGSTDATVRRNRFVPDEITLGLGVVATTPELLTTLDGTTARGEWLTTKYPTVVLGSAAAGRLGVDVGQRVWIGERWWTVTGVLQSLPLAPEVDREVLVGWDAATTYLGFDGHPTMLYERSTNASVGAVRDVLARTVNPEHPEEVEVSRPSDALQARVEAAGSYTGLLVGLGAVALLVGGVGVANTMVISVLERRREIGLRRSLGATRGHVRVQFLVESLLLSLLGGVIGAVGGSAATVVFARLRGLPPVVPLWALAGSVGATLVIGALAGLYPAVRAARLSPTVALAAR